MGVIMILATLKIGRVIGCSVPASSGYRFRLRGGHVAPLPYHVLGVVVPGSSKQMRWPHACRIVAMVKGAYIFRQRAGIESDGNPIGEVLDISKTESSVSVIIKKGCPNPTLTKFWSMRWYRAIFIHSGPKFLPFLFCHFWDWSCSHLRSFLSCLISVFRAVARPANANILLQNGGI